MARAGITNKRLTMGGTHMTVYADIANASMQALWIIALFMSIRKMREHRDLKGVSFWHVALTQITALWFVGFYAHLNQWWSVTVELAYAALVAVWIGHILYYAAQTRATVTAASDGGGE
jgi:hypothetical protein